MQSGAKIDFRLALESLPVNFKLIYFMRQGI